MVVPARIADILDRRFGLDKIRKQIRGTDPELDAVLLGISLAGLAFRTASGTVIAESAEPETQSDHWVGTSTAAGLLGMTDRGVRKALADQRLTGTLVDGRWRTTRADIEQYRASRAA
ncbi:hypothetical protein [Nakamurella sp.]|uniref:hypothetical protein n=1 Tax=Nakamurella sp. TaxID=1869182 RepID=UPI003B3B7D94